MDRTKVKLLNNYQLIQLAQNNILDKETLILVRKEITSRNISTIELKELQRRHDSSLDGAQAQLNENNWHPFYTAFSWKRHFKHIALLKAFGRNKDAKVYQLNFYVGMGMYMLIFVLLIFLIAK
ncbi:hypothetical protein FEE95_12685 [Maribacter algarum]|uniref:Uncharacterized protein n=1 Tax=Maribacter algarum (ex Zhang et al. 2020) TaxID=2578118 RepID=A0A5S3PRN0_9FLAO|nr:hypothetical protein [Maribacter algarum]TMM57334.1 hypothetical protein FEE95_12685 [Maribacter algarum]